MRLTKLSYKIDFVAHAKRLAIAVDFLVDIDELINQFPALGRLAGNPVQFIIDS